MRKIDVPVYDDPKDFENGGNKYPCDTQYMVYNTLEHKYYLTKKALDYYGIDAERRYISNNPNKIDELIRITTKKVYDTIQYLSGWKNFQVQMYRIARSQTKPVQDQYSFRKDFERALVEQARRIVESGDSLKYSATNLEKEQPKPLTPQERYRSLDDISEETLRTLEYLGLTRWFTLQQFPRLNDNEY